MVSTNASVRRRVSGDANIAQPTSAILTNGTTTLKSRIKVAGTGLPTSYSRLTELTMLLVC